MIIGAGLSGLIASYVFQNMHIVERAPEPVERHKALLRFRSDSVAKLTGIDFKKVRVRKGIMVDHQFVEPNIALANRYTLKCLGEVLGDRSIWNLDPVDRWIAPEDFYWQMVDTMQRRIEWDQDIEFTKDALRTWDTDCFVSTAPMHVMASGLDITTGLEEFKRAPVTVVRFRAKHCNAYQTIYFPGDETPMYRASITGDLVIAECAGPINDQHLLRMVTELEHAFGGVDIGEPLEQVSQQYGKIAPINEQVRKHTIMKLTNEHNIFSLGRFAVWKNLLLDDVVEDAAVIKRLMRASSYERQLHANK